MNDILKQRLVKFRVDWEQFESDEKYEEAIEVIDKEISFIEGHLSGYAGLVDTPVLESLIRDLKAVKRIFQLKIEIKNLQDQLANHTYKINQLEQELKGKKEGR